MYDDDHRAWCEGNDEVAVAEENGNNDEKHEKTSAPNQIKHLVNAWAWVNVCECVFVCSYSSSVHWQFFCDDFAPISEFFFFFSSISFASECDARKLHFLSLLIASNITEICALHFEHIILLQTFEPLNVSMVHFLRSSVQQLHLCVCVYVCALWICQWTHYQDKRY